VKPFLFHFTLRPMLSFDSFLDMYETKVIDELTRRSNELFKDVRLFTQ
jgi:hypothetical protein